MGEEALNSPYVDKANLTEQYVRDVHKVPSPRTKIACFPLWLFNREDNVVGKAPSKIFEVGFDAVIWPQDLVTFDPTVKENILVTAGMLPSVVLGPEGDVNIASPVKSIADASLQNYYDAYDLAVELGAHEIIYSVGRPCLIPSYPQYAPVKTQHEIMDKLRELIGTALDSGIDICMENSTYAVWDEQELNYIKAFQEIGMGFSLNMQGVHSEREVSLILSNVLAPQNIRWNLPENREEHERGWQIIDRLLEHYTPKHLIFGVQYEQDLATVASRAKGTVQKKFTELKEKSMAH